MKTALKLMSVKGGGGKRERGRGRGRESKEREGGRRGSGREREKERGRRERAGKGVRDTLHIIMCIWQIILCSHFARVYAWTIVWLTCAISDVCAHIRLVCLYMQYMPTSIQFTHTTHTPISCYNRTASV